MRWILCLLSILVAASPLRAQVIEIYKCLDGNGRPLYTSDRRDTAGKKCELVSREANVVPSQPATQPQKPGASSKSGAQPGFPREDPASRASAKERQRGILERELEQEEGLLTKARRALAEQENVRTGDERNYARVLERLQPYKDTVEVHTKNLDALKQELGKLSR